MTHTKDELIAQLKLILSDLQDVRMYLRDQNERLKKLEAKTREGK